MIHNLKSIIEFSSASVVVRASNLQVIRSKSERLSLTNSVKRSFEESINTNEKPIEKKVKIDRKIPKFFGKVIRHKYDEDRVDIWYRGSVVSVLDEDELDDKCEFEVKYDGNDDKYDVMLVEEWRKGWVIIEGKV